MKIGIDGRILDWKYSGIARYVRLLLSFSCFKGSTVYFPGKSQTALPDGFIKKNIKTPFKRRELYEQIILPVHLFKDRINLFIQPYNFGIPFFYSGKSALIIFDIIPLIQKNYFFYAKHKKWAKWNYRENTRLALKKADVVVTDSESAKEDILKYFPEIKKEKIIVIYYAYAPKKTEKINFQEFAAKKNLTKDYILITTGLEERKNTHLLIDAFYELLNKKNLDLQLVITGYSKTYLEKLTQLVKKKKIQDKVVFTDAVSEEEKNALIQHAKLIVNSSGFEGFGIPLLEAAEYEKPIVASDIPVFHEVGGDYPIFFENNSSFSLFERLEYFFENESKENNRSKANAKALLERFSVEKMENSWKNLLAKLS